MVRALFAAIRRQADSRSFSMSALSTPSETSMSPYVPSCKARCRTRSSCVDEPTISPDLFPTPTFPVKVPMLPMLKTVVAAVDFSSSVKRNPSPVTPAASSFVAHSKTSVLTVSIILTMVAVENRTPASVTAPWLYFSKFNNELRRIGAGIAIQVLFHVVLKRSYRSSPKLTSISGTLVASLVRAVASLGTASAPLVPPGLPGSPGLRPDSPSVLDRPIPRLVRALTSPRRASLFVAGHSTRFSGSMASR